MKFHRSNGHDCRTVGISYHCAKVLGIYPSGKKNLNVLHTLFVRDNWATLDLLLKIISFDDRR